MNSNALITVLVLVIIVLVGFFAYNRLNAPRSMDDKLNGASAELKNGNLGNAVDEMKADTPMEKIQQKVENATDK